MDREDLTLQPTTTGHEGQTVEYEIPVSIYPGRSGLVIVNAPGAGELKEGSRGKYDTIARHLQEREQAAFVTFNPPRPDAQFLYPHEPYWYRGASWNLIFVEGMAHVIDHVLERSEELCGSAAPTLYLSGFSAGGSVCGAVASHYPAVERLLLLSAYDSVGDYFYEGIRAFTGDISMAFGEQDAIAGYMAYFMQWTAASARSLRAQPVPDCDHGFRGEKNGRILSKAFDWAFFGDDSFPSPEGGLWLYGD